MRWIAAIFLGLAVAAGLFVAGFALLHGIESPTRETTGSDPSFAVPPAFESSVDPIDRRRRRVAFGNVVDASTKRSVRLSGTVKIEGATRLVLRALTRSDRVLAVATPDESGRYEFEAVPAGPYELRVLSNRGAPLHSVARLDVFADRNLDIASPSGTPVRVTVMRKGTAIAKAYVILEHEGRRLASGTTDQSGGFTLDAGASASLANHALRWRVWLSGGDAATEQVGTQTLGATETELRIDLSSG